ncbi:cation diffusion facilitator family transporter [Fulvimarina sp. MAC8]|uniref:cation diffusion facilitator family transporter n=1 Tax=Fulvimarina sp. MAC8 TaxID=3162874 RepID=UPI0032ED1B39
MGKYLSQRELSGEKSAFGGEQRKRRLKPRDSDSNAQSKQEQEDEDESGSKKTIFAALFANLGIAITKFGAALFTGSSAMLAEGIHSVIDTTNQALLLVGLKRAKKPADEKHPFGYGSEIYFWAFMVAIFLFALGSGVSIYEGVAGLLASESEGLTSPSIALGVLFIAFCFEGYSWTIAWKEFQDRRKGGSFWKDFQRLKDPSIFVVLFEDSAACLGIIIAAIAVGLSWLTGSHVYDAIGSIVVGIVLGLTAILLAIEVKGLLVGETADPDVEKKIQEMVGRRDEIIAINELRTLHLGPNDVLMTMSVDFKDDVVSQTIERIVTEIEEQVKRNYKMVRKVFVEVQSQSGHERFANPYEGEGATS